MGAMYWLRLVMMILVLVVVVWTIHYLNSGRKPGLTKITLCPARVKLIEFAGNGVRLEEKGTKWIRSSTSAPQELDSIAVEKWFSRFCSIQGEPTETGKEFQPILRMAYVSGETRLVLRASSGEFQLQGGQRFFSHDLDESLRAFSTLPEAKPPGH